MSSPIQRYDLIDFTYNYAILIGIDEYPKINADLTTPLKDASALKNTLIHRQGFEEKYILLLPNPTKLELSIFLDRLRLLNPEEEPSIAYPKLSQLSIEEAIKEYKAADFDIPSDRFEHYVEMENFLQKISENRIGEDSTNPHDCFVFYYAGHGKNGSQDDTGPAGYLYPSDAAISRGKIANNPTLVHMEEVFEAFNKLNAHHTLLILDCCFAGAFRRAAKTRSSFDLGFSIMTNARFDRYKRKRAWQVLASAGPSDLAVDLISERGEESTNEEGITERRDHSPFAKALIEALSGTSKVDVKEKGKELGDGVITAGELLIFLYDEVERITNADEKFDPQHPNLFPMALDEGGQFIFCDPTHRSNHPLFAIRQETNPYKGLAIYQPWDHELFFGRKDEVELVMDKIESAPTAIQVISGASGSGKSSFVRAGLIPAYLKQGYNCYVFRPGEKPWTPIQLSLEEPDTPITISLDTLKEKLLYEAPALLTVNEKHLLFIDQYEEVYTECTPAERAQLEQFLLDVFDISQIIILSIRSDFEWQLESSVFGQRFWGKECEKEAFYRLPVMDLFQMRQSIIQPALLHGYGFEKTEEENLVDTILQEVDYAPAAMPLLSYAMQAFFKITKKQLDEQWEKGLDPDLEFTFELYNSDEFGGLAGALRRKIQSLYDASSEKQDIHQCLLKNIFIRMARLNEGQFTRRQVYRTVFFGNQNLALDELDFSDRAGNENNQIIEEVLDNENYGTLIRKGGKSKPFIEWIHDSIINTWPTYLGLLNEFGQEKIVLQRQLWEAVVEYHTKQKEEENIEDRGIEALSPALLWDNSPKLRQLIQMIIDPEGIFDTPNTTVAQSAKMDYISFNIVTSSIWNNDISEPNKETLQAFKEWWNEKYTTDIPDDYLKPEDLVMNTETLLDFFFSKTSHWFNKAEVAFIKKSWGQRNERIKTLKREKEEAIQAKEAAEAGALASKAMVMKDKNPTVAYNMAFAAFKKRELPETDRTLWELSDLDVLKYNYKLAGHTNVVISVSISSDYKLILTASFDKTFKLWNLESGQFIRSSNAFPHRIFQATFSPSGNFIATISGNRARIWQTDTLKQVGPDFRHSTTRAVAFSSDEKYLAVGGHPNYAMVWDIKSLTQAGSTNPKIPQPIKLEGHSKRITFCTFSNNRHYLVTASDDSTAIIWDLDSPEKRKATLNANGGYLLAAAFSPDDKYVITGSQDGSTIQWDTQTGELQKRFIGNKETVQSIVYHPDGNHFITAGNDYIIRIWNIQKAEVVDTLKGHTDTVLFLDFYSSPQGNYLASSSADKTALLWNLNNKMEVKTLNNHHRRLSYVTYSKNGKWMASLDEAGVCKIWDPSTHREHKSFNRNNSRIRAFDFLPDENSFLTANGDKTISLWNIGSGKEKIIAQNLVERVLKIKVSPDGKYFAICFATRDPKVRHLVQIWDLQAGREFWTYTGHTHWVLGLDFSPDSHFLVSCCEFYTIRILDFKKKREEHIFRSCHGDWILDVAFSPNGKYVASSSRDKLVKIWDLETKQEYQKFTGHTRYVNSVAFSPNGQYLLSAGNDHTARLWEVNSQNEGLNFIKAFKGHSQAITSAVFSTDGQQVATASNDGHVKIWDSSLLHNWNDRVYKLSPEERKAYGIPEDIEY